MTNNVYKKRTGLWAIPTVFFIVGLGLWLATLVVNNQHQSLTKQLATQQGKLSSNKSTVGDILTAKQPNVSAAANLLDKIFTIDWTIADQKAFDGKAHQMAPYVSQSVIQNSLDFKADPDKLVTQTGVVMTYDHMDCIPTSATPSEVKGQAIVYVKSHLKDASDATTRFVYNVTYNPETKLVTQLDRIGTFQLQSDSSIN